MEERVRKWLESIFEEEEFQDCFVLDVVFKLPHRIEVFLDADSGITLRKCQRISRQLESHLDLDMDLDDKYVLEVSSGGAERPLSLLRQYPKHIGRTLIISVKNGKEIIGKLTSIENEELLLEQIIQEKGKKKTTVPTQVPFEEIEKSIIKISFK